MPRTNFSYGSLPYKNGEDKKRDFPLTRQVCIEHPGCFWGISIIERLIPIQRRYNAVKNRKQEYLNRITIGVIDVEEDAYTNQEDFEEGIGPGTIMLRKRGADKAQSLSFGTESVQNLNEEDRLLQ